MNLIKEIAGEFVGMFLGDARLAIAILALVAATAGLIHGLPGGHLLGGAALLCGALLILVESVRRAAKPRAPR